MGFYSDSSILPVLFLNQLVLGMQSMLDKNALMSAKCNRADISFPLNVSMYVITTSEAKKAQTSKKGSQGENTPSETSKISCRTQPKLSSEFSPNSR